MPSSLELQGATVLRETMPLLIAENAKNKRLLQLFPIVNTKDEWKLVYERRQLMVGLQHARGAGGATGPIPKAGLDQFEVDPGMYGDHFEISEDELNKLRTAGDISRFETFEGHMNRGTQDLTDRYLRRVQSNIAQMLTEGAFTANDATGREKVRQIYNIQPFTPGTTFDNLSTAAPLAFFRKLIPQLELGVSVNFRKGVILCSRPTANLLVNNANTADLFGKRREVGSTINSLEDINKIFAANDLPQIETIDDGYYPGAPTGNPVVSGRPSGSAAFRRYLTNGKMVLVGAREDGAPIGEYRQVKAVQNGGKGGEWYAFQDNTTRAPWNIIGSMGHNGGPVPYYPEALAVINAAPSNSSEFADLS